MQPSFLLLALLGASTVNCALAQVTFTFSGPDVTLELTYTEPTIFPNGPLDESSDFFYASRETSEAEPPIFSNISFTGADFSGAYQMPAGSFNIGPILEVLQQNFTFGVEYVESLARKPLGLAYKGDPLTWFSVNSALAQNPFPFNFGVGKSADDVFTSGTFPLAAGQSLLVFNGSITYLPLTSLSVAVVPEPAHLAGLLGLAAILLVALKRVRRA